MDNKEGSYLCLERQQVAELLELVKRVPIEDEHVAVKVFAYIDILNNLLR